MSPQCAPLPLLEVADRAELRVWLDANYATSPGVRLAVGKKGGHVTTLAYGASVALGSGSESGRWRSSGATRTGRAPSIWAIAAAVHEP